MMCRRSQKRVEKKMRKKFGATNNISASRAFWLRQANEAKFDFVRASSRWFYNLLQ